MIRVKLREVFDVKKFVCCFVSVLFIFISLFAPVVSADDLENVLKGDKLSLGKFESYEELHDNLFLSKIGASIDDYYFIFFSAISYDLLKHFLNRLQKLQEQTKI